MTSTTDPTEADAWQHFRILSIYCSKNEAVSRLPSFNQALLHAHAKWAELFVK
jgi:hypothetical protein